MTVRVEQKSSRGQSARAPGAGAGKAARPGSGTGISAITELSEAKPKRRLALAAFGWRGPAVFVRKPGEQWLIRRTHRQPWPTPWSARGPEPDDDPGMSQSPGCDPLEY